MLGLELPESDAGTLTISSEEMRSMGQSSVLHSLLASGLILLQVDEPRQRWAKARREARKARGRQAKQDSSQRYPSHLTLEKESDGVMIEAALSASPVISVCNSVNIAVP